jgi:hypothetical protein
MTKRNAWVSAAMIVATIVAVACPAVAVKTQTWQHQHPKDFEDGTFDNTVVTSDGEVLLGHAVKTLHDASGQANVINALARGPDGAVYAASGGSGVIYRVVKDEAEVFATLPDKHVFSLVFAKDGMLLAGTGGQTGRIFRIDADGKHEVFFEHDDIAYVWAMVRGGDGQIYAATGTEGKLFEIAPSGTEHKVLFDAKQKNLLCLAADRDGILYLGSDEDGLVFRLDPQDPKPYVLYDAKEPEISAIVLDRDRNVYAATADANAARPGRSLGEKPGGKPDGGSSAPTKPANATAEALAKAVAKMASKSAPGGKPNGEGGGNAIYRISRDGFVTEVFRKPVMVLGLAEFGGTLYAATGSEGRLYEIALADEVTTHIAKLEASQAVSILRLQDGSLIVGTANEAAIVRVGVAYASDGTYVSAPLDAEQIVRFGRARWRARIPEGTKLTLATRSSNVKDPEDPGWDAWSGEVDATAAVQIASPAARFLQYRLTFKAENTAVTPRVDEIEIFRLEDNRAPKIARLIVDSGLRLAQRPNMAQVKAKLGPLLAHAQGKDGAPPTHNLYVILWTASDPNDDTLLYDLFYRRKNDTRWIRFAEDEKETLKIWDTRTVADGPYEIRVVATDKTNNPADSALTYARVSDVVIVDNTPPTIEGPTVEIDGRNARIRAGLSDTLSVLADAHYCVDSDDEWQAVLPADDIFDAKNETLDFTIEALEPGDHHIVLRAVDANGNAAYWASTVTIGP